MNKESALVVFSGGQDSTTCLGWAIKKYGKGNVFLVSFTYGQKHSVEIECALEISKKLGLELAHHIIDVSAMKQIADSALVTGGDVHQMKDGLPSSFVPGRNLVFLTHAAQLAYKLGCKHIVTGVCETDFSGYPDCRDIFIKSFEVTTNLAMEADFEVHTPLMWLNKAETWKLAADCDFLEEVRTFSHTCYEGNREIDNEWGKGCGTCPSCVLRKKGYEEFKNV